MEKERFLEIICFVYAFFAVVLGIIFIFFGEGFLEIHQWPTTDLTILRMLGAAFIGFGFASILAWKRVEWVKVQIVVEMEMAWLTIVIIVMIVGYFQPPNGVPVIIWMYAIVLMAFDFGFFYTYYMYRKS
ncbi:MAG: hypothetical protein ACFFAS_19820 [Promethearchaeota archaeon]